MHNPAAHASPSEVQHTSSHSHVVARVGPYQLAVPINTVMSIHEAPAIFAVPCAQAGIIGAIRFQGMAVPVFDVRRSLRLPAKEQDLNDRLILVDAGSRLMAIIVDEVLEFAALDGAMNEEVDALFGESPVNESIIAGIASTPTLCAVLNPAGLLQPDVLDEDTAQPVFDQPLDEAHPMWARTMALAEIPKRTSVAGIEAALFRIGAQRFGVPLPTILEFFNDTVHSPIPFRSNLQASLVNRRGEAVMLFDPRTLLGLPPITLPPRVDGLVLSGDRCKLAIAVDALEGLELLAHSEASIKPGRFCLSAHHSERGTILLLDVSALLQAAQSALVPKSSASTEGAA